MNIQQLQYIIAVDEHRHFQRAADACYVTPATLSMMIKKLEQELDVTIFDRSKQPIVPTDIGNTIIDKAKTIIFHVKDLENTAKNESDEIAGEIRIGIIPTLAPYLTHHFLPGLMDKFPLLKIKLFEWNTVQIIDALNHDRLDIGIAATPLHRNEIKEHLLFNEKLVAYTADIESNKSREYIVPADIDLKRLWLLEEDHCLRAQVANLCSLKKKYSNTLQLDFEAGSIATLINIVDMNKGITILPELAIHALDQKRKDNIREFTSPTPVRQISLLTYKHFMKTNLLNALHAEIVSAVLPLLTATDDNQEIIAI